MNHAIAVLICRLSYGDAAKRIQSTKGASKIFAKHDTRDIKNMTLVVADKKRTLELGNAYIFVIYC